MERLAADMGGTAALTPGDHVMLGRACDLLLMRPTTQDESVRLTGAAWRIIERIRKRVGGLVAI
jgi:hypothetical protein